MTAVGPPRPANPRTGDIAASKPFRTAPSIQEARPTFFSGSGLASASSLEPVGRVSVLAGDSEWQGSATFPPWLSKGLTTCCPRLLGVISPDRRGGLVSLMVNRACA